MDEEEARRLFGLAAAQGISEAQYELGTMLRDGEGGPKNEEEARRLFGLAAAQGYKDTQQLYDELTKSLKAQKRQQKKRKAVDETP